MKSFKRIQIAVIVLCLSLWNAKAADVIVEAESFNDKGGWVVDQQFADLMGSPYLMAHGMGQPVPDATTAVAFPETGAYRMFVRTCNWTSPWLDGKGPGKFQIQLNGETVDMTFGDQGHLWMWQEKEVTITDKNTRVTLHDLTGFNGRCDALYFTKDAAFVPPTRPDELTAFRYAQTGIKPGDAGRFDLVVVGGGIAGICAAASAARLGLKVAIIHDRPVWGGNNSSEVRVHLGGRIGLKPYPELGGIVKELSPLKGGNAQPADQYEDEKKIRLMDGEPGISQFLNFRAFAVTMDGRKIRSVTAKHTETGEELIFSAPVFADCTGDGTVGVLAGADFVTGRESRADFGEPTAPEKGDKMTMGSSVQWYSEDTETETRFPAFNYGLDFNEENARKITKGEWTWETGMNYDQITDFERIRDYGLLVVYSNWSFLKNGYSGKDKYARRSLSWVAYVAGKRESRRLLGDHILKEQDITESVIYPDGTASTSWSIDLHYPDPENTKHFPGKEFVS
ncbi:MAG: FAD-dependent oxidoreductase, partial [Tannerella sp.]|nr:FAD-dependent oxidoreductase [Tannerella sp.]